VKEAFNDDPRFLTARDKAYKQVINDTQVFRLELPSKQVTSNPCTTINKTVIARPLPKILLKNGSSSIFGLHLWVVSSASHLLNSFLERRKINIFFLP
jgi:hypothetical protein